MPPQSLPPRHPSHLTRLAPLGLALALLASACATAPKPDPLPVEHVNLDPTLIRATVKDGQVTDSQVIHVDEVFEQAQADFKANRCDDAIRRYTVVVDSFPDSDQHLPSLYNRALCHERQEKWEDALKSYAVLVQTYPGKEAATDALYRSASCLARLERHDEVLSTVARILDRTGLTHYDRVEALVRRGDAYLALGKLDKAEDDYRQALLTHERTPDDQTVPDDSYFVVAAQYGVGQVEHRLFREVKFRLPVETMEKDIERKVELFQQAQRSYVKTMKRGNSHWATAAGYAIGQMYEEFYADLLNAEIPKLEDEEARVYFDELRSKLRPLMERALQIYEKNITLSERYGVDNAYTRETEASLARLKRYISDAKLQADDETRIRKGDPLDRVGAQPPEPTPEPAPSPSGS
jgi:tetratricopeptide (TPR) repeat protein